MKGVSCATQLSLKICKTCNKCPKCCLKSACRGQTSKRLGNLAGSGCRSESSSDPERGLHPPLSDPAKLGKISNGHKLLCQSPQDLYLLEALHQLIDKNAVELVDNQRSLGFFNQLFLVPKHNNKWRPILDLSKLNLFLKAEKFKIETLETIRIISPTRGVGYLNKLQGCLLPHINTGTVQEISEISCRGPDIPVQSTAIRFVHSTHGDHCSSKGGEADGHTQGYKDPPVPRRLIGQSQILPGFSPAYTGSSKNVSTTGIPTGF